MPEPQEEPKLGTVTVGKNQKLDSGEKTEQELLLGKARILKL